MAAIIFMIKEVFIRQFNLALIFLMTWRFIISFAFTYCELYWTGFELYWTGFYYSYSMSFFTSSIPQCFISQSLLAMPLISSFSCYGSYEVWSYYYVSISLYWHYKRSHFKPILFGLARYLLKLHEFCISNWHS